MQHVHDCTAKPVLLAVMIALTGLGVGAAAAQDRSGSLVQSIPPPVPLIFAKFPSALIGHRDEIRWDPGLTSQVRYCFCAVWISYHLSFPVFEDCR